MCGPATKQRLFPRRQARATPGLAEEAAALAALGGGVAERYAGRNMAPRIAALCAAGCLASQPPPRPG